MTTRPMVYFYCRDGETHLQEDIIALAEGFRELGVPFFANCNYWRETPCEESFLIRHDPEIAPADCDVVVVSYTWPYCLLPDSNGSYHASWRSLPADLFAHSRRFKTAFMDHHDGYRTISWEPEFRQFDLILRAHLNARAMRPDNLAPWALGITNRMTCATQEPLPFSQRWKEVLINFGASHPYPHQVRELAATRFDPVIAKTFAINRVTDDLSVEPDDAYDALMWRQTGRRYSRAYYDRLKRAQAVSCFCGTLIPPAPYNPECYMKGDKKAQILRLFFTAISAFDRRPSRSIQWDSFRFWEALCAGCVAFNIDLDRCGVQLPVHPQNWVHYIGIDFDRIEDCIERIHFEPDILEKIARDGRNWALQNYSPAAVSRRFLRQLGLT
jgi:hypothetical protein